MNNNLNHFFTNKNKFLIDGINMHLFNGNKQITEKLFMYGYIILHNGVLKGCVLFNINFRTLKIVMIHSISIVENLFLLNYIECYFKKKENYFEGIEEIVLYVTPDDKLLEAYKKNNYEIEYGNILYYKITKKMPKINC